MKEVSDQVRGIIFVVLVMAVIFAWSRFYRPAAAPPQQKQAQSSSLKSATPTTTQSEEAPAPVNVPKSSVRKSASVAAVPVAPVQASAEHKTVVESALSRVEVSNRGAVVKSWKLKKYNNDPKPPQPLELVDADSSSQLGW